MKEWKKSGRHKEKVELFFQSFEPLQDEKKKRDEAQLDSPSTSEGFKALWSLQWSMHNITRQVYITWTRLEVIRQALVQREEQDSKLEQRWHSQLKEESVPCNNARALSLSSR